MSRHLPQLKSCGVLVPESGSDGLRDMSRSGFSVEFMTSMSQLQVPQDGRGRSASLVQHHTHTQSPACGMAGAHSSECSSYMQSTL